MACRCSENYLKKHALHAAFVIAKHDVVPMDLVAIDTSAGQRLYSFLSIGWGLIADVDIESERYRSMGNARFTLMAVVKIAGLYWRCAGMTSYIPVPSHFHAVNPVHISSLYTIVPLDLATNAPFLPRAGSGAVSK